MADTGSSQGIPSRPVVAPDRYVCLFPGCTKDFGRLADLDRHLKTVTHFRRFIFECSARGCKYKGIHGFSRRDKLTDHQRKWHQDLSQASSNLQGTAIFSSFIPGEAFYMTYPWPTPFGQPLPPNYFWPTGQQPFLTSGITEPPYYYRQSSDSGHNRRRTC
ncbi:MAG: hypothetical protein M1839_003965 [Geoglossum umbratile]|nr:MAG: hypothetical protein M1839_003965 [Geoglossum umbratile]